MQPPPSSPVFKVCHISETDSGGAATATYRLHKALLDSGLESAFVVRSTSGSRPGVRKLEPPAKVDRLVRRLERRFARARARRYAQTAGPKRDVFSQGVWFGSDILRWGLPAAEVYQFHWMGDSVSYRSAARQIAPRHPFVWRLPDMNPMTGGCHYAFDCERFTATCGRCPQLGSDRERDLSRSVWRAKSAFMSSRAPETTRMVATSRWLQQEAQRSSLLSRLDTEIIANGVDTTVFAPRSQAEARARFGLPQNDLIALFVADGISNRRKGFDLLQKAVSSLKLDRPLTLVTIGRGAPIENAGSRVVALGEIKDERLLSFAYSAADIFIMPTRAEAFGNVIIESLACGTPVVAFAVGGVLDLVRPNQTGLLASPEDIRSLKDAIEALLSDEPLRRRLSGECRHVATTEYTREIQAARYAQLYETLISASKRHARSP